MVLFFFFFISLCICDEYVVPFVVLWNETESFFPVSYKKCTVEELNCYYESDSVIKNEESWDFFRYKSPKTGKCAFFGNSHNTLIERDCETLEINHIWKPKDTIGGFFTVFTNGNGRILMQNSSTVFPVHYTDLYTVTLNSKTGLFEIEHAASNIGRGECHKEGILIVEGSNYGYVKCTNSQFNQYFIKYDFEEFRYIKDTKTIEEENHFWDEIFYNNRIYGFQKGSHGDVKHFVYYDLEKEEVVNLDNFWVCPTNNYPYTLHINQDNGMFYLGVKEFESYQNQKQKWLVLDLKNEKVVFFKDTDFEENYFIRDMIFIEN